MEEADVLGDRIAIMSEGRIRAVGTSIHLKSKYGTGYRINLILNSIKWLEVTKRAVARMVPLAVLEDESAGSLIYQFPPKALESIPKFVEYLERNPDGHIEAWGVSHSTLEEVFLKVIRSEH